ncbi:cation-transporting P-type ATPase [Brasilonema octagenarum UFV-E1]|uniref:Cation-transporting P-type ATPase n=1 Tax=Brasilonema sennae CENA114 TaxID=415709 RepID=A0A856MRI7_9CYAN|nr:HAD-IC family P-type ATPase [Brasilonema sennae]QDL12251.1 cation-transporting P-type ATPase [Brasilonema sennae CENA114]QDL18631.1 cation-transporting P-type ATPase [Brasilonema octagenarum UFV-E1]
MQDKLPQNSHSLDIEETIDLLETDQAQGLNSIQVKERIARFGFNELTGKKGKPWWLKFLLQYNQPLLYILLIAGATKAIIGEFVNAFVIWGVTTTNAIIGYVQESKAEGAIAALAKSITTEATVIRENQKLRIPSRELVPGDVVLLTSGDKVPADLRLIKVRNLQVDESALTGESVAVEKEAGVETPPLPPDIPLAERKNMAYTGGFVTFGQATGIVVATGNTTETGRISQLLENKIDLSTPLTRKFDKFSKNWLYMVLGVATLTLMAGLQTKPWRDAIEATVALIVGSIPEGLPAVVTVTLAIGVSRMARRHAIIRKLPAVETLGSATVICSDKTGTLTENQMTVQAIYAGGHQYAVTGVGYSPEGEIVQDGKRIDLSGDLGLHECLSAGLLCNDSHLETKNGKWVVVGDPTEGALITSANKLGLIKPLLEQQMPRLDGIPFESEFQYMATLHATPTGKTIYVKGSVEAIAKRCTFMLNSNGQLKPIDCQETLNTSSIEREVNIMARQGLRVLALAKKLVPNEQTTVDHVDIDTGLIFLGLQGMIDPPRESAMKAVKACQEAGIQVKMITGDHAVTAQAIATRMGINKNGSVLAFSGAELAQMDYQELAQVAEDGVVFARVAPEQKLRLVEALQSKGEIVAMTGDGVNDAPALKQADIGIAMGMAGTEVAKEAADMLLTDDNFASIKAAVEEGRAVYKNLVKAMCFILPVNGGESMTILFSTLVGRELPILSLQILWLNVINSITMTVPLAFEPKPQNVMQQSPRRPNEALLSGSRIKRILAISLFNWIVIFGVFEYIRQTTGDINLARTMAINALIAGRIFYLLSLSQLVPNLIAKMDGTIKENVDIPAIGFGIIGAIILQLCFSYVPLINEFFFTVPLRFDQWLFCFAVGLPMIPWAAFVNRFDPPN